MSTYILRLLASTTGVACCICLGCARGSLPVETASQPLAPGTHPPGPANAALARAALPALPVDREPSALTETLLDGAEVYLKSGGASVAGTALDMGSAPDGREWALYRFHPAAEALDSVAVLLDVPAGSSVWIGLSDYQRGCWCINGPYTKSKTLALDDGEYASPEGNVYVAVVVAQGAAATVNALSVRTIRPNNELPQPELILSPDSGVAPFMVHFDASGSSDPDGEIRYYLWDFDGDSGYDRITFGPETDFIYTVPDLFHPQLAVADDYGAYGEISGIVEVFPADNQLPLATLQANPGAGDAPLTVTLDASDSSDPDGSIVRYDFDFDGDGIWDAYDAPASVAHTYSSPGVFDAKVRLTDNLGAQTTSTDTVTVNVPGNALPVASLTAAPDNGTAPLTVTLDASASSDTDGSIVRYDWDCDGDGNYEFYDGGDTLDWTYAAGGDFSAKVRVTDNSGAQDTATVTVDVTIPGNAEPLAALTADKTESYAPYTVTFDASGSSDSDGSLVQYEWDFDGDGGYEEYGPADAAVHTYTVRGMYRAQIRVTDDSGAQDTAELNVSLPSAWWCFGMEPTHNRRSPYNGAQTNNVKWSYTTGQDVRSSAAIGPDGTIYFGSYDNSLYALKPDGSLKWSYATGNLILSSPALGADGTIYFGSYDNSLYALNPNGSLRWSYATADDVASSPALGADGTIYIGSYDDKLYALHPDGSLKWSYTTGNDVWGSPSVGPDGTVYVGSIDQSLYALRPDGSLKWSYATNGYVYSAPALGTDGTLYLTSLANRIYALHSDGSLNWWYPTGGNMLSSPALGADGTIYAGSADGKLYAINPDGSLKWDYTTGNNVQSSPAIGADGTVYIGSHDNSLYAINPDGSLKWSAATGGVIMSSPAIGADGKIYVGSYDDKLYAFGPP